MVLSQMDLLCMRYLLQRNITDLASRVAKYKRFSGNSYDGIFEEKSAVAESELSTMTSLLSRVNDEIALHHFLTIRK